MSSTYSYLGTILGVDPAMLEHLVRVMEQKTGRMSVLEKVAAENEKIINTTLRMLHSETRSTIHVLSVLRKTIFSHEKHFLGTLAKIPDTNEFGKAAIIARQIAKVGKGFFLKKDHAAEILRQRPPRNVLAYLKAKDIDTVLRKYDVAEVFSALRFIESNEWMHETFEKVYSRFTPDDFEERPIEVRVLSSVWKEIAEKFVAKKHHNVSHLKEFGIIFLNPIREDIPGKFLRDFALLLHYFHEIEFYSKLFKRYAQEDNFAERFQMFLRGDVKDVYKTEPGEWLIVQRYLSKENPQDPRLFLPRVNPEAMHWFRGERDLTSFHFSDPDFSFRLWHNLDWVGGIFQDGDEDVVSFDLEDNAMSLVSFMEGKQEFFNYHQREAMWTKIFMEYVGGEAKMEKLLIDHFPEGIIQF